MRFQFSLKGLFLFTTVAALLCWWFVSVHKHYQYQITAVVAGSTKKSVWVEVYYDGNWRRWLTVQWSEKPFPLPEIDRDTFWDTEFPLQGVLNDKQQIATPVPEPPAASWIVYTAEGASDGYLHPNYIKYDKK